MRDAFLRDFDSERDIDLLDDAMAEALGPGRVAELARAHLALGGQRIRARLALRTAAQAGLPLHEARAIAVCVELLHNASLVHDDLQDGDHLRRGRPAIWRAHGTAAALCAGDLMLSSAYGALAGLGPAAAPATRLAHDAVAATIRGQSRDLRSGCETPFAAWVEIARAKSGPLIALAPRLVLSAAGRPGDRAAARAGALVGTGYQIADDLADRDGDAITDTPNACLALEAGGRPGPEARRQAAVYGLRSLDLGRRSARALPGSAGAPLARLAERVAAPLREIADAA